MTGKKTPIAMPPDIPARIEEGLEAVAAWEADYGAFTDEERAAADRVLDGLLSNAMGRRT